MQMEYGNSYDNLGNYHRFLYLTTMMWQHYYATSEKSTQQQGQIRQAGRQVRRAQRPAATRGRGGARTEGWHHIGQRDLRLQGSILPRVPACDQGDGRVGAMRTCSSYSWTRRSGGRGRRDGARRTPVNPRRSGGRRGRIARGRGGGWMLCSAGHTHGGFINRGSGVL
jgi:hypothetical protein